VELKDKKSQVKVDGGSICALASLFLYFYYLPENHASNYKKISTCVNWFSESSLNKNENDSAVLMSQTNNNNNICVFLGDISPCKSH
jgi:hypothetical protein